MVIAKIQIIFFVVAEYFLKHASFVVKNTYCPIVSFHNSVVLLMGLIKSHIQEDSIRLLDVKLPLQNSWNKLFFSVSSFRSARNTGTHLTWSKPKIQGRLCSTHRINKLMFSSWTLLKNMNSCIVSQCSFASKIHWLTTLSVLPSTFHNHSPHFHQMPALKVLLKKPESLSVLRCTSSHYFPRKYPQFFLLCIFQTLCKYQPNHYHSSTG